MDRLDDFRLGSDPEPPPGQEPDRGSRAPIWMAALLLAIAAVVAGVVLLRRPGPPTAAEQAAQAAAAPQTDVREPLGPAVEPIELPPLVLTDPLVRELLGRLSSSPTLAVWLATDGLIRAFVVSVENVADGSSPARHVRALAPRSPFRTIDEGGAITIDPRSFSRYDGIANAAAAMEPADLARVYSMLKPRLIEAYKELGHPDGSLDVAVERAIAHLLQTPVVEDPIVSSAARALIQVRPGGPRSAVACAEAVAADGTAQRANHPGPAAGCGPRARHPAEAPPSAGGAARLNPAAPAGSPTR